MKYEVTLKQDYNKLSFECDDMDLDKGMFDHLMFIITNAVMPTEFTIMPSAVAATIDDLE